MNTPLLAADQSNAAPYLSSTEILDPDSNSHLTQMLRGASSPPQDVGVRPASRRTPFPVTSIQITRISFVTVFVTSMSLIHMVLLWASFLSTNWIEEHLYVNVSFLPAVDILVRSMDLGSLIGLFRSTNQSFTLWILAITTVVIPCLNTVVQPLTIMERHHAFLSGASYRARSFVDTLTRFGFLIVYAFIIIDFSTSSIDISWDNTKIDVSTKIGHGFLIFTIALTMALLVTMTLRLNNADATREVAVSDSSLGQENSNQYMRILEEEEVGATDENIQEEEMLPSQERFPCPTYSNVILFEAASISILSFVAAIALPLVEVTYHGVAAGLLAETTQSIYLREIVIGQNAGSTIILAQGLVIAQILFFPALALLLAVYSWFRSHKRWLEAVYPFVNGTTLVAAILLVVPALQSLTESILNSDTSGLCQQIKTLTGESCISIHGTIEAGTWCLMAHALSLEVFIILVMRKV